MSWYERGWADLLGPMEEAVAAAHCEVRSPGQLAFLAWREMREGRGRRLRDLVGLDFKARKQRPGLERD